MTGSGDSSVRTSRSRIGRESKVTWPVHSLTEADEWSAHAHWHAGAEEGPGGRQIERSIGW